MKNKTNTTQQKRIDAAANTHSDNTKYINKQTKTNTHTNIQQQQQTKNTSKNITHQ